MVFVVEFGLQGFRLGIWNNFILQAFRRILRWIFRKWEGVVGTGWSLLRIGTGAGHL